MHHKLTCLMLGAIVTLSTAFLKVSSEPLHGQIEASRIIAPVESALMPGQQLNLSGALSLHPKNEWCQVPSWFVGTWEYKKHTVIAEIDYVTGRVLTKPRQEVELLTKPHGHQHDSSGRIWHYLECPYSYTSKIKTGWMYNRVLDGEMQATEVKTVRHVKGVKTQIDLPSKRIRATFQSDTVNTYEPLNDGLIHLSSLARTYDAFGNPCAVEQSASIVRRTKAYQDIDELNGQDLKMLFREFLMEQGQSALIPLD